MGNARVVPTFAALALAFGALLAALLPGCASDKGTVAADRAQVSSDAGHIVGRKHGGARKGGQQ